MNELIHRKRIKKNRGWKHSLPDIFLTSAGDLVLPHRTIIKLDTLRQSGVKVESKTTSLQLIISKDSGVLPTQLTSNHMFFKQPSISSMSLSHILDVLGGSVKGRELVSIWTQRALATILLDSYSWRYPIGQKNNPHPLSTSSYTWCMNPCTFTCSNTSHPLAGVHSYLLEKPSRSAYVPISDMLAIAPNLHFFKCHLVVD